MAMIEAIGIPDTKLGKQITELVRDTEPELLFNHSSRVYYFGALTGLRRGLRFDREMLYAGAMFHDMGLTPEHSSQTERFEVDGASAARDFLKAHKIAQSDIDLVWAAIALHTTPGKAFYNGIKHKPETTFGNVKADVLADKDPHFVRGNFCSVIRGSSWKS